MRSVPRDNPNRGKRRASPASKRPPRTSLSSRRDPRAGTTGVTITVADPAYVRRYGAAATIRHADRETGIGGAVTIGRNLRRRADIAAAAGLAREIRP